MGFGVIVFISMEVVKAVIRSKMAKEAKEKDICLDEIRFHDSPDRIKMAIV